jgi:hypothetical protein
MINGPIRRESPNTHQLTLHNTTRAHLSLPCKQPNSAVNQIDNILIPHIELIETEHLLDTERTGSISHERAEVAEARRRPGPATGNVGGDLLAVGYQGRGGGRAVDEGRVTTVVDGVPDGDFSEDFGGVGGHWCGGGEEEEGAEDDGGLTEDREVHFELESRWMSLWVDGMSICEDGSVFDRIWCSRARENI